MTGSEDPPHDGVVTEAILKGQCYLVIRGMLLDYARRARHSYAYACMRTVFPCQEVAKKEGNSLDVQRPLAWEFHDTVEDIH